MDNKKSETKSKKSEAEAGNSEIFELSELYKMKFRDPVNGQIVMVRRAFKPRGKLELYQGE